MFYSMLRGDTGHSDIVLFKCLHMETLWVGVHSCHLQFLKKLQEGIMVPFCWEKDAGWL